MLSLLRPRLKLYRHQLLRTRHIDVEETAANQHCIYFTITPTTPPRPQDLSLQDLLKPSFHSLRSNHRFSVPPFFHLRPQKPHLPHVERHGSPRFGTVGPHQSQAVQHSGFSFPHGSLQPFTQPSEPSRLQTSFVDACVRRLFTSWISTSPRRLLQHRLEVQTSVRGPAKVHVVHR